MHRTTLSIRAAALLLALAACGRSTSKSTPDAGATLVGLAPLPPAPKIQVQPEAVPGANGKLAVVSARPQGEFAGALHPTITFSKPMVALGSVEDEARLAAPATIDPPLDGSWRWLGSASVEFEPKGKVPYGTAFKVTVPAGLAAIDGSKLAAPYAFSFSTPRPELQDSAPADGDRWVTPDQVFKLVFNQPIADVLAHVHLNAAGKDVALKLLRTVNIAEERRASSKQRAVAVAPQGEFQNRQTRYELTAARPLPQNAALTLTLDANLRGSDGPLTITHAQTLAMQTYGPLQFTGATACGGFRGVCPYGPVDLTATNDVDLASLKAHLSVKPAAEIDWDHARAYHDSGDFTVVLPGRWRPGTRYALSVSSGTQDVFHQSAPAFSATVRTDDVEPSLDIGPDQALLEAGGDGALPVHSVNVAHAQAAIYALTPELFAKVESSDHRSALLTGLTPIRKTLDLPHRKNVPAWTPLEIRDALGGGKGLLFYATVTSDDLRRKYQTEMSVLGQVTDLAVHAKLGASASLVWVTSLSKGEPVPGAQVALYDKDGKQIWTGTTDGDGIAELPGLEKVMPGVHGEAPFALVSAAKDGDLGVTASGWEGSDSLYAFGIDPSWETERAQSLSQVFTDRGIYRPGDSVDLKGFLRARKLGPITNPGANVPVEVVVNSPKGDAVAKLALQTTAFGGFAGKFAIARDAPLGTYEVDVHSGSGDDALTTTASFRVEEYRAPQFQVDVTTPRSDVIAGDPMSATVISRYLFGGAMSGAHVRWTSVRTTTDFTPPGNGGFEFGPHAWWWNDDSPQPTSDVAGGGEGDADAQGNLQIDLGKAEAPGGYTYQYTVEAETTDVNRQRVANRATITVHPAAVYPGIRTGDGFGTVGKPVHLELVAVDPKGARQTGDKVDLRIERRDWKSIKKQGVGGTWFTESEPVETPVTSCALTSAASAVGCDFTPKQPGLYLLVATATDAQGRTSTTRSSVYAIGPGWVSWQRGDTDRIDLVADKASYDVGDTAHILVKSPYPEADAVLTVEREGVLTHKLVHLAGAATALDVPIDASLVPNAYVGIILVRGRVPSADGIESGADPGRPATRFGYVELKVEKKSKRLTVAVKPEVATARPRQKVGIDVKVTDASGKPVHAEVALWAVDEGVLRLTDYHAPDPLDAMHPHRGLSVRIAEPLVNLVQKQLYGEKGENAGGGGGDDATGSGFRSNFKVTALFAPLLETDANGIAHADIQLPDNLTTFRVMAQAIDMLDEGGAGEAKVAVSKKLMALPALPRFARAGDAFEAGVVVHTTGADIAQATVTAQAQGVSLIGPSTQAVALGDGKGHEVRFRFRADTPGTATLRFSVEGGGERDGVQQKIPIELPVQLEAVATYGDTTDKRVEGLAPPGGVRTDVGGLDVTLASTVLGGFNEGMRQLIDYPYGCAEQMSSRLIPFVALREIYGKFGGKWPVTRADRARQMQSDKWLSLWLPPDSLNIFDVKEPDEIVRLTVANLLKLQNHDGGFRYWPAQSCSADLPTAYTVLALARAREVGYPVRRRAIEDGQRYLRRVASGECNPCDWMCVPVDPATRAFALYTLARTGAPQPSSYADLFAQRQKLPLFAQAMLADAMYIGQGDRVDAHELLTEIMNRAQETPREVHFQEIEKGSYAPAWSSDTRTTAIVLQTLTDISPDHPYVAKMAHYLAKVRQGTGRFRNTQEAAFSLMALAEVVRTKEHEVPDFTANVALGEKDVADATFKGRSTTVQTEHVPISALGASGAKLPFTFSKQGDGVLYYGALLRYAPKQMPLTPLDRGMIVQRWFEPYSGGGQAHTFNAGDLVRVRVRVATPQERHYVAVDVPLPAGLEVVDTSLASTARLPDSANDEGRGPEYEDESADDQDNQADDLTGKRNPWAETFWSPFNYVANHDDRVVLFSDDLPPGVHLATFVARATTPGTFLDAPAKAEEMYTPEVFGRSAGGTLTVVEPAAVAQK